MKEEFKLIINKLTLDEALACTKVLQFSGIKKVFDMELIQDQESENEKRFIADIIIDEKGNVTYEKDE